MATDKLPRIVMSGIRGRDGASPLLSLTDEKCREALNVDFRHSMLGRKRGGASSVSLTGGTAQTGVISFLGSFLRTGDQSAREMWSVDNAATPRWKRLAGGTAWADVSVSDACTGSATEINAVAFDGKIFFGYGSAVDRLHCYDGTSFRRVGLAAASVPTVADQGIGTYAATLRYYKVRWVVIAGGVVTRAGELSSAVSFTPSGSGVSARVTVPTAPGEGETHWEVYASPDDATYARQSQVVVATTTYDDSTAPAAYTGTAPPTVNSFITPPSGKYLIADKKRLVGAGAYNPSGSNVFTKSTRFWWSAPLGSTDNGDSERVQNTSTIKNYDDIEDDVNGLGGPVDGSVFVFSYNGVWKSSNTGLANSPYVTLRLSGALGTIHHKTIVTAEDENGQTTLYWLSPVGPVRYGPGGFQHCHNDVDDIWATVNLAASTIVAHGIFHRDIHQIWWWVATGSNNEPDTRIVFDTELGRVVDVNGIISVRRGWAKHTGASCAARCSCVMSSTLGAAMSRTLKPYIGRAAGTAIWKCDTGTTDAGTAFQSYVLSKPYLPWGLGHAGSLPDRPYVLCDAQAATTLQLSVIGDFGYTGRTTTSTFSIAPLASESARVIPMEGAAFAVLSAVQFQIGDASALDAAWNIDAVVVDPASDGLA